MRVRILVVDDSPSMRTVIRAVLEDDGYEVAASEDGEEALASFQATTPDLVITDIYMSGMDGLSLVRGIRTLPTCRFLPPIRLRQNVFCRNTITCSSRTRNAPA